MSEMLIFDISGKYATFKVPETTRAAITFPFPPRTALMGMIGAIMGLERNSYWMKDSPYRDALVALEVLKPGRKWGITVNFTQTKNSMIIKSRGVTLPIPKKPRLQRGMNTQQRLDLLVEPKFRVYFSIDDESIMTELEHALSNHLYAYPAYLGHANFLAEIDFIGRSGFSKMKRGKYEVPTVVPISSDNHLKIKGDFVLIHGVPMSMATKETTVDDVTVFVYQSTDKIDSIGYQISGQENPIVATTTKQGSVIRVESDPQKYITPLPIGP